MDPREQGGVVQARGLRSSLADVTFGFPVEQQVATFKVLGEDRVGRMVGDGGQQLQGAFLLLLQFKLAAGQGVRPSQLTPHQAVEQ